MTADRVEVLALRDGEPLPTNANASFAEHENAVDGGRA